MTMYVRTTVPMTLTISSQTEDDDVLLDGNHEIALLPLWAAQRDEFQILWQDGKVEVSLDPYFDDSSQIITEIPASEIPGSVDANLFVLKDEGGRVPNSALHTVIPLDEVVGTNETNPGTVVRFLGTNNAVNHLAVQNGASGQPVTLGVIGEEADIDILALPGGGGRLFVGFAPVLTGVQRVNAQGGSLSLHATDAGTLVTIDASTPATITVQTNADDFCPIGTTIEVAQLGTGQVTIAGAAGVTVNGTPGLKISARYGAAKLRKVDNDVWLLTGNLSA